MGKNYNLQYLKNRKAKIERLEQRRKFKYYIPLIKSGTCAKVGLKQKGLTKTKTTKYLDSKGFYEELLVEKVIEVPKNFSLHDNYYESLECIKAIYSSLHGRTSRVVIDFYSCKDLSLSSLFLIRAIIEDLENHAKAVLKRFSHSYSQFPKYFIIKSKFAKVNALLYTTGFIRPDKALTEFSELKHVAYLPFFIGGRNRTSYTENTKGKACKDTIRFINKALRRNEVELTKEGWHYLDSLISEILNNAEDHNVLDKWYLMGTLLDYKKDNEDEIIGQLDLVFLNFGFSIYEGLEANKCQNKEKYQELVDLYDFVISDKPKSSLSKFNIENFFTLFALQEGVSRLSFEEESRGTGTVKFIKAFMELGSFVDNKNGYKPKLTIISGKTMVVCDNETQPFTNQDNGKTYLTLNKENEFTVLPLESHLKNLKSHFPGTLFSIKIYLSSKYFKDIVSKNGSQEN